MKTRHRLFIKLITTLLVRHPRLDQVFKTKTEECIQIVSVFCRNWQFCKFSKKFVSYYFVDYSPKTRCINIASRGQMQWGAQLVLMVHCHALHGELLHYAVWHCTKLFYNVLYYTAQHCNTPYNSVLYCTTQDN